jgi:two-component system CAI-1 autoinducer sensor kinase/phosphatase CqsS
MAAFAVIEIIGQPLYYGVWHSLFPQNYENAWLRAVCVLIAVPMLFESRISRFHYLARYLPIYWLFILLFELPFFFVFMTVMNHLDAAWALSAMAALMLLVILTSDWLMTCLLSIGGVLLAWLGAMILSGPVRLENDIPAGVLGFTYLFGLVAGCAFNYRFRLITQEKLSAVTDAAGTMAHELRTPLLGIRAGASGLNTYLPILIEGYELARDQGLPVTRIRSAHFHQMQSVLERIHNESNYASTFLDMLQISSNRHIIDRSTFERTSMSVCIEAALERYPFNPTRWRDHVHWTAGPDFEFIGTRLLMVHVLFNLLKNSLYHLAQTEEGRISLWTVRHSSGVNQVHFRDTGPGIAPEELPRIFERFYSGVPQGQGTGIGLTFVQIVTESFGGAIHCDSVPGQYTEFVMTFPEIE